MDQEHMRMLQLKVTRLEETIRGLKALGYDTERAEMRLRSALEELESIHRRRYH